MLHHFLTVINKKQALEFYNRMSISFLVPRMKELPSIESFLQALSNKPPEDKTAFDEETDAKLEAYALKKLHEGRAANE